MTAVDWLAIGLAAVVAALSPLVLRPALARFGVFDVPNARSSHTIPTLRGGGVASLLGVVAGTVALVLGNGLDDGWSLVVAVVAASAAASLLGLIDDVRGLRAVTRLAVQLLIGASFGAWLGIALQVDWWWAVIAAAGFSGYVNFANFMDGANAMSGLHGVVVGGAYALVGVIEGKPWLATIGLIICVVFAAFLPWNLIPPGMFLGDVGSYLLGALIAGTALAAIFTGSNAVAVLAPLAIYLADAGGTVLKRALRRKPVFEPHRDHVYQVWLRSGAPHLGTALYVAGASVLCSIAGLFAVHAPGWVSFVSAAAIVVIAGLYLFSARIRQHASR